MNGIRSTLLIVDDEPSCRKAFRMALEDEYHLIETDSGDAALNILMSGQNIDLVLLDYLLSTRIDGLEVLNRMKKMNCKVPVIIVTGKGSEKVAIEALRSGAKNYIVKPFKIEELRAAIKMIIDLPIVKKSKVDQAIEFINKQYCQPISARAISKKVGISLSHLEHVFKKEVGHPITHSIYSLRIEKAKRLLLNRNLLIKEIAAKAGFKDQCYFCKMFKKYERCTPTEYRKKFR